MHGRRKGKVKSELSMEPRSGKIRVISAWKKKGTSMEPRSGKRIVISAWKKEGTSEK